MRSRKFHIFESVLCVSFVVLAGLVFSRPVSAQNPELQQRVSEVEQAAAKNKQALAQYTWVEQVTLSLKGEEKKQERFQVRFGPDGQQQKTSLDQPAASSSDQGGRRRPIRERVVAKKKEEYADYADKMKALAQQYLPPSKERLQQAYRQGNVTMGPSAGNPDELQLIISNYLKPKDSMTLVFDITQKKLLRIQIASYMDGPKDAMNLTVQYSPLPDGSNQISSLVVNGVSKQMNVATQNSDYQHL
jgi:hypothetical protein